MSEHTSSPVNLDLPPEDADCPHPEDKIDYCDAETIWRNERQARCRGCRRCWALRDGGWKLTHRFGMPVQVVTLDLSAPQAAPPPADVQLVTAPDEQRRCCVLDGAGNRCPSETRYWIGANGVDDYTHVCADHLEDMRRPGDEVREVGKPPADEPKTVNFREWL